MFPFPIHKEGIAIIWISLLVLLVVNAALMYAFRWQWLPSAITALPSLVFFSLIVWFFRNPDRSLTPSATKVMAPADGKIVVIEEVVEDEYFNDKRIQVSIFMSPLNVHVNRYPASGTVSYNRYHPGKYLVAWHPKSSKLNERSTVVVKAENGKEVLMRQIAGAVARRIVTYSQAGDTAIQGADMGFIKFGSRVDLFLPPDAKINVAIGDISVGNRTVIAEW